MIAMILTKHSLDNADKHDHDRDSDKRITVQGMNAGKLIWEPMHRGYGAVVALGSNYTVSGRGSWDLGFDWGFQFRKPALGVQSSGLRASWG